MGVNSEKYKKLLLGPSQYYEYIQLKQQSMYTVGEGWRDPVRSGLRGRFDSFPSYDDPGEYIRRAFCDVLIHRLLPLVGNESQSG